MMNSKKIETLILLKLRSRSRYKTMCPSEVLPHSQKKNKARMEQVRAAAKNLEARGKIIILQKSVRVDPANLRGPIRLKLPGPIRKIRDTRLFPEDYRVARGEQGVLSVEPYKSELLPHWRFKTPKEALDSARTLFSMFEDYRDRHDFIGMDMARKFIQMGGTRARRYANHRSGKKYSRSGEIMPNSYDQEKARSAALFFRYLKKIENSQPYADLKLFWKHAYG